MRQRPSLKTKYLPICLFLFTAQVHSYPIFFGCKEKALVETHSLDEKDLFKKILELDKAKQQNLLGNWCKGSEDCMKELKQILQFAKVNYQIAMKQFHDKLAEMKIKDEGITNASKLSPGEFKKLVDAYSAIKACEEVKIELKPEDFKKDDKLKVFYPYHSNYMYITGCSTVDSKKCAPISAHDAEELIKRASIMGTDRYVTLSLAVMEQGADSLSGLYLDPIGVMDSIGCSGKQVKNGTDGTLDSFGTSYNIRSETIKNPELTAKVKRFYKESNQEMKEGNSFYCYDVLGKGSPEIQKEAKAGACCLELGFEASPSSQNTLQSSLIYHFIDKTTKNPFKEKVDPAFRLQRFNGYTDLMGAAEGVPAYRAGLNYYNDPAYGYQAMDYILNSFLTNPWVTEKVKEYQSKFGVAESILCKGKEDGTYHIDSDYYFNKHKNTPRMSVIKSKFKKGIPFSKLTTREQNVLITEMIETAAKNSTMPKLMNQASANKIEGELYEALGESVQHGKMYKTYTLSAEKVYEKTKGQLKLPKTDVTAVISSYTKMQASNDKVNALYEKKNKVVNSLRLQDGVDQTILSKIHNGDERLTPEEKAQALKGLKNPETIEKMNLAISHMEEKIRYEEESKSSTATLTKYYNKNPSQIMMVMKAAIQYGPIEEQIKLYKGKLSSEQLVKFKKLYNNKVLEGSLYNIETAYKTYFTQVYPSRKTVGQASSYTWRKLDDAQVSSLAKKLN